MLKKLMVKIFGKNAYTKNSIGKAKNGSYVVKRGFVESGDCIF